MIATLFDPWEGVLELHWPIFIELLMFLGFMGFLGWEYLKTDRELKQDLADQAQQEAVRSRETGDGASEPEEAP